MAGLCAVLLAPLLIVDMPPLLDYPNHLARLFVLASLPHDPVLARFYAPHWTILPNLALDLLGLPLIRVLPIHVAGRLLIAAALLLPVLGTILYNAALTRSRTGRWWSLGVGLVAYNSCLLYGFLNFSISLGVALLLAAAWLRWRERRPTAAILLALAGAPAPFAAHLMGLLFFAILIGSAELSRLPRLRGRALGAAILQRGAVLVLVFALPAALYWISPLHALGGDAEFAGPSQKLVRVVAAFSNYNLALDILAVVAIFLLPAIGLRRGSFPAPAGIAVVVLAVAYLLAPTGWKGTFDLDTRFIIMLGFMLFAGFVPASWPPTLRRAAAATVVLLFVARMALLMTAWAQHRSNLADVRRVLDPVQPGQVVYVAQLGRSENPAYWQADRHRLLLSNGARLDQHLGALALIEHRAYWPFEFDVPSQQPIETLEPYRTLANRVGNMPAGTDVANADLCGFDYVLLIEADAMPALPAERFRLLRQSGLAALYAITRCGDGHEGAARRLG